MPESSPKFLDRDLRTIAEKISPYLTMGQPQSIRQGNSGSSVSVVDLFFSDQQEADYRNDLFDFLEKTLAQQPDPESSMKGVLGRLVIRNRDPFLNESPNDQLVRLLNGALENTKNRIGYSINDVLDRIKSKFVLSKDQEEEFAQYRYPPTGKHFMKRHLFEEIDTLQEAFKRTQQSLENYRSIASQFSDTIPELADFVEFENSILTFYRPAFDDFDPTVVNATDTLVKEDRIEDVLNAVTKTAEWIDNDFIAPHPAEEGTPHQWLLRFLGKQRYSGSDTVLDRLSAFFEQNGGIDFDTLSRTEYIQFDGNSVLPNPLILLNDISGKTLDQMLVTDEQLRLQPTRAHGDLHMGNIFIHKLEENPAIIDFGDYFEKQSEFFDLLYLEFNTLWNILKIEEPEHRKRAYSFLDQVIFGDASDIMLVDVLPIEFRHTDLQACHKCVSVLRAACSNNLRRNQAGQDNRRAFWITAIAVGLNFIRKRPLNTYTEKMFCLIYTAMAYRNLMKTYGKDVTDEPHEPFRISWTNPGKTSTHPTADSLLKELKADEKNHLILVVSPLLAPSIAEDLLTALQERLRWHASVSEQNLPETLGAAFRIYRDEGGDTNLRACIQKIVKAQINSNPEVKAYINLIQPLVNNPYIHVFTYDWYDYLTDSKVAYSECMTGVVHICGHPSLANSVMLTSEIDDSQIPKLARLERIHALSDTLLYNKNKVTRVVFLGEHNFSSPLMQRWLSNPRTSMNQYSYHVDQTNVGSIAKFRNADPMDFLQQLVEKLGTDTPIVVPDYELPRYVPEPVNHVDTVKKIKDSEYTHIVVMSSAGQGKSEFLKRLCRLDTNDSKTGYRRNTRYKHVVIDLENDHKLRSKVINIWHHIFDQIDGISPPKYDDFRGELQVDTSERTGDSQLQKDINAIWSHRFFNELQQLDRDGHELFICIDGVAQASHTVQQWIKFHKYKDIKIVYKGRWQDMRIHQGMPPFGLTDIIELYNNEDPHYKVRLIVTERIWEAAKSLNQSQMFNFQPPWGHFHKETLPILDAGALKDILKNVVLHDRLVYLDSYDCTSADYVQTATIALDRYDERVENLKRRAQITPDEERQEHEENALNRQLDYYLQVCYDNLLAVVAAIRTHIKLTNLSFKADNLFPRRVDMRKTYEAIYLTIKADYASKQNPIQGLARAQDEGDFDDIDFTLQLLLYRRFTGPLIKKLFSQLESDPFSSIIPYINRTQIFYQPKRGVNDASPQRLLVDISLHKLIVKYYEHNYPEILADRYAEIITCLWEILDDTSNTDIDAFNKAWNVSCMVYYYSIYREIATTNNQHKYETPSISQLSALMNKRLKDTLPTAEALMNYCIRNCFLQKDTPLDKLMTLEDLIHPPLEFTGFDWNLVSED